MSQNCQLVRVFLKLVNGRVYVNDKAGIVRDFIKKANNYWASNLSNIKTASICNCDTQKIRSKC